MTTKVKLSKEEGIEKHQLMLEFASMRRQERTQERETMRRAAEEHSVRFHTVGAYTFCYRRDEKFRGKYGGMIEVASAIRSIHDKDDKHYGRMLAFQRFKDNNRMLIRVPSNHKTPRTYLDQLFDDEFLA